MMDEPPSSDAATALANTLRLLSPDAGSVIVDRHRTQRPSHPESRQLVAIPNAAAPRLLVPLENRVAASHAMRRFSAALSFGAIAQRVAVGGALRVGGGRFFPDRLIVEADVGDSIADHLGEILGQPVTFSVGVGTARVNRKPILQIFDQRGRSLAFAKIATTPQSQADVRSEASALSKLTAHEWRTMAVPRVISEGEWRGLFVLVISALPTRALQPWRVGPPVAAMAELAVAFGEGDLYLDETVWWNRISDQADDILDARDRSTYQDAAERLQALASDRTWPIGAWHGDWTSWNMARRRGIVQVWDWERFETGIPVGLDRYHYAVNDAVLRSGASVAAIERGLRDAGARPDDHSSHVLAAAYLLTVAARYLAGAQHENGHLIRERSLATLSVLDRWLA